MTESFDPRTLRHLAFALISSYERDHIADDELIDIATSILHDPDCDADDMTTLAIINAIQTLNPAEQLINALIRARDSYESMI